MRWEGGERCVDGGGGGRMVAGVREEWEAKEVERRRWGGGDGEGE